MYTKLLIELYRSEQSLWDSGHANYLNVDIRQAALRRIAGQLGSGVTNVKYFCYVVFHDKLTVLTF